MTSDNIKYVSRLHALGWRHKHSMHEGLISAYEDFLRSTVLKELHYK